MPDWNQILDELNAVEAATRSQSTFDLVRRKYLKELHKITERNVIVYYSGWLQKPDILATQINDEDKNGFMTVLHELDHSKGLDLILHTPGGETGATESLVDYLRSICGTDIRAFVPQLAMSGGTVIACGCKEIYMGKHSSLGPIDPQIGGIPAHGVIEEFNRAFEEVKEDPDKILVWQPILSKYPPAFIGRCEKSLTMVREMVIHWLKTGMFADDDENVAAAKSEIVADNLINYSDLKSHDRHLHPKDCKELIGLNVHFLEDDEVLQDAVLSIHHACMHTLAGTQAFKIIENHTGKAFIQMQAQIPN